MKGKEHPKKKTVNLHLKLSRGYDFVLCGYFSHKLNAYIHMELKINKILCLKLWPWQRVKVGHKGAYLMVPYEKMKGQ